MIEEEGLDNIFARHHRLAEATRAGGARLAAERRARDLRSRPAGAIGFDHRRAGPRGLRRRPRCASSASTSSTCRSAAGSTGCEGHVFRIGHMGDLNEPMILGSLAAVEMALELAGVPHGKGGVAAAMDYLVAAE